MSRARQLTAALAAGATAGALLFLDARIILAVGALAAAFLLTRPVLGLGARRVAGVAWAATAFTAPLNGVRLSDWFAMSDAFLVIAVVAMLPSIALAPSSSSAPLDTGVMIGLAMIAVGGVVGTFFAGNVGASLVATLKFVVAAGGSVAAVRLWAPDAAAVRGFCALWLAGAALSAVWALTFSTTTAGRPAGLSTHPNHLAVTCLLAMAMALGFTLSGRPQARRLGVAAFVPLVLALSESGSRAAVLGFFVMVPTVAVLSYRVHLAVRAGAVAALLGVAVLTGVVHVPPNTGISRLFGDVSTPGSDAARREHLGRSIDRFQRHPLTGEGFEFAREAHNIYLQVLVAAGPLGLIGLVVVAGSVLRASSVGIRASRGQVTGDHALLAGLAGGFVGYLVTGAFQNILWDRYLWLYAAAVLALAASLRLASAPVGAPSRREEWSASSGDPHLSMRHPVR